MIARFKKNEGRAWGAEGTVIELTKQVGELSARVMTREGYYFKDRGQVDQKYTSSKDAIADELFDILFATIRLADHYEIDLPETAKKLKVSNQEWFKSKGITF